jgi:uncharacterized protein (UPF0264 family)
VTGFLASVMSADEAETVLALGADIVDLKDPHRGALGALPLDVLREALARVGGRRPVSATVGDLPMEPDRVAAATARTGETGVDFVKVGLFPGGDRLACLDALAVQAAQGLRLVAVMFADQAPDFTLIEHLAERGFAGVMLDTAGKQGGGLRRHLDEAALRGFVERAKAVDLLAGLAGSLTLGDVPALLSLGPDYLGFRGALTGGARETSLDPAAIAAMRGAIPASAKLYPLPRAKRATAAAGAQQAARAQTISSPSTSAAKSL